MKKIILICITLVGIGHMAKSQQLTINETVAYINQVLSDDAKHSIKLILSTDGHLTVKEEGIAYNGNAYDYTYTGHISDLQMPEQLTPPNSSRPDYNPSSKWLLKLRCKEKYCMQKITNKDFNNRPVNGKGSNISDFSLETKGTDKYSTEKLLNAFKYLFALAEENGMFTRIDNDPFAPKNYGALEIESTSKNGSIKLSKQGGVYHIPVTIGGITKSFVFDTGASEVLISEEYERVLIQNGTIKREHYLAPALYRIADGSIVQCRRVMIPKLIIGTFTISNVKASIGVGYAPLLLGKTVLDKFSNWSINNQTETLNLEK